MRQLNGRGAVVLLAVAMATAGAGETRFHQYTKRFKEVENPATVVRCSYFGGEGSEWLAGGGLLPDGRIFLAGSTMGPTFAIGGAQVVVIGADGEPPPGLDDPVAAQKKLDEEHKKALAAYEEFKKKNPKKRRRPPKKQRYRKPQPWSMPEATGFAALLSADGKKIEALCRLGWRTGCITSACSNADGAIFVAGMVGAEGDKLGAEHLALKAQDYRQGNVPGGFEFDGRIFVGRLQPDLKGFAWLKTLDEFKHLDARVSVRQDGGVHVEAGHQYVFDADGKLTEAIQTWIVNNWNRGVDPNTGTTAVGADNMTGTGREPWRQPVMTMTRPDGTQYHMYAWSGALVGIDSLRLVSDSSLRGFEFAADGTMYLYGWSDGGNTVLSRNPFDLRDDPGHKGLGMSMWGANATSGCHLVHVNPQTGQVLGQTVWMGYLTKKNAPSGLGVDSMLAVGSDSLVLTGGCGWGIIQTGHNLWPEEHWETVLGAFLTVMTPDLAQLRFSSGMMGCGYYPIGRRRSWSLTDNLVEGRRYALAFCAASNGHQFAVDGSDLRPAPGVEAIQTAFGGGACDGHFTILDLGPTSGKE